MNLKTKEYEHYCEFCGKLLVRKRFSNGRLEDFLFLPKGSIELYEKEYKKWLNEVI